MRIWGWPTMLDLVAMQCSKLHISFKVLGFEHKYNTFQPFHSVMRQFSRCRFRYDSILLFDRGLYHFKWKQMLFFGWNGILIALEYSCGHWHIFEWMTQHLPQFVITALVLCAALPQHTFLLAIGYAMDTSTPYIFRSAVTTM